jgi:hypothetical protein
MQIIRDTREKQGWDFVFYDDVESIVSKKINCGDYTTALLKDEVVFERKASVVEIATNLGTTSNRERFYRECERMKPLKRAYIICEFQENHVLSFPTEDERAVIERERKFSKSKEGVRVRLNGRYLRKLLADLERDYPNIEVVFAGSRDAAEKFTHDMLKYWEKRKLS